LKHPPDAEALKTLAGQLIEMSERLR